MPEIVRPRTEATNPAVFRRVVGASVIGSVIEWFDFAIFAAVSGLVLGGLFFPVESEAAQTLLGLATFAVGYFSRPIGGLVFGHFGDRLGRKGTLITTMTMMGLGTLLIAFLPTYDSVGIIATIGLVLLRIVQGVAVGGEYGGAMLMVMEHGYQSRRRGLFGGLINASASLGVLSATGVLSIVSLVTTEEQFQQWGWRIPFVLSALLLAAGLYIRLRVAESPVFAEGHDVPRERVPVASAIRMQWRRVLGVLVVVFGLLVIYNAAITVIAPYARSAAHISQSASLGAVTIGQLGYLISIVVCSWLSDRVGRRPVVATGIVGACAVMFVLFPLINSGGFGGLVAGMTLLLIFVGAWWGPLGAYMAELFDAGHRYSGLSLAYQTAAAMSALGPVVMSYALSTTGSSLPVVLVIALIGIIGLVCLHLLPETAHRPLDLHGAKPQPQLSFQEATPTGPTR